MTDKTKDIEATLKRAEEILQTARHGYDDLTGKERSRRFSGLRNLIVFGRSVTFVLQNLKSVLGEETFNNWYEPKQEEMKQDPLLRFFVTARNEILKQGKLNVATSAHIHQFSGEDFRKFGPPPPGTSSFIIGDQTGGSGWEVELPDGSKEMYYLELPANIGEVKQQFANLPEATDPEIKGKSIEELCALYLDQLDSLIEEAHREFLNRDAQHVNGRRLPSYLRVVK